MQQDNQQLFQQCQLIILKEVHRICVKHSIPYFLSDGTLLGAVRHKGFIPWDDDIDIGMLREHFKRFIEVCPNELNETFFLQTDITDPGWAPTVCRVLLNGTNCIERNFEKVQKKNGVFIDIQPYDVVPNNKVVQKIHFLLFYCFQLALLKKLKYMIYNKPVNVNTILPRVIILIISNILPVFILKKLRLSIATLFMSYSGKNRIYTKFGGNYYKNQQSQLIYDNITLYPFEDYEFYIPQNYHAILSALYGDYMTPPPENMRRGGHDIIECGFGEYEQD